MRLPLPLHQWPGEIGVIREPCKLMETGGKRIGYFLCLYTIIDDYVDIMAYLEARVVSISLFQLCYFYGVNTCCLLVNRETN